MTVQEAVDRDGHQRRCTATTRAGERCRSFAMLGGSVCRLHGGSAPQVRAKAAQRLATQAATADATRALAREPGPPLADPLEALGQVATEAIALKDALAARVNALNEMRYAAPGSGTEQLRAEVAAYERALDRVARFADLLARHDFRGRQVEIEAAKVRLMALALGRMFDALGLTDGKRELATRVLFAELRALAAAEEADSERPAGAEVVRGEVE